MTIRDLLSWATTELMETNSDDASRDAEYLLAHVLDVPREYILAHPDRALRGNDTAAYKTLIDRRRAGELLSILTGQAWFYGLPFTVSPHVLTPRSETELIITLAHEALTKQAPTAIIDVGTGSGCIAITLAKTISDPPVPIIAIDISPEALAVAQSNAEHHRIDHRINFLEGNLLDPLPRELRTTTEQKWIIGNLPYLPRAVYDANPALVHEPKIALFGGEDGLDCIRGLLEGIETVTPPWTLFMEIDPTIMTRLAELLHYHFPQQSPRIVRDIHGHERVCVVERR